MMMVWCVITDIKAEQKQNNAWSKSIIYSYEVL